MDMRWLLGDNEITWNVSDIHKDTIEMSGRQISCIITYGNDEKGETFISRDLVFPLLRKIPNNTHASLTVNASNSEGVSVLVNGSKVNQILKKVVFNGILTLNSQSEDGKLSINRIITPSVDKMVYIEHITISNLSNESIDVEIPALDKYIDFRGTKGIYNIRFNIPQISERLHKEEFLSFDYTISAKFQMQSWYDISGMEEIRKRLDFVKEIFNDKLVLESENKSLDCEFSFSKLRAAESIFDTYSGLLHGPGGGAYYAAVWANDQAEYVGPFFPYLGYKNGNEASINAYNLFRPFMGKDYQKIPSSIIAEGLDIWEGAGDRGDAAMYLYGLSRFLLAYGDKKLAEEYFPALCWCAEYCKRKLIDGVIESDSDELEGRFPSGKANLCTNSLAYAGLMSASDIACELGYKEKEIELTQFAGELRINIEKYFGFRLSGYDTYRYYKENTLLRSWICIPLTMGILDRSEGTVNALLSDRLFGENGLVCQEGDTTFWDRSTLYALRGIFNAGKSDDVYRFLNYYTQKRLLGEHVPYPVEAYPEGNQRHLSAESGLYARIITEGLFGITPRGFKKFDICPSVPRELGCVRLKNIRAFNDNFHITVKRLEDCYEVTVEFIDKRLKRLNLPFGGKGCVDLNE